MFQQWLHDHGCTLVTPVINAKGGGNLLPQHIEPYIQHLSHAGVERIVVLTDLEDEAHPDLVRQRVAHPRIQCIFCRSESARSLVFSRQPGHERLAENRRLSRTPTGNHARQTLGATQANRQRARQTWPWPQQSGVYPKIAQTLGVFHRPRRSACRLPQRQGTGGLFSLWGAYASTASTALTGICPPGCKPAAISRSAWAHSSKRVR